RPLEPPDIFHTAVNNVTRAVEVECRRVGGADYRVPVSVPPRRSADLSATRRCAKASPRSQSQHDRADIAAWRRYCSDRLNADLGARKSTRLNSSHGSKSHAV